MQIFRRKKSVAAVVRWVMRVEKNKVDVYSHDIAKYGQPYLAVRMYS